MEREGGFEPPSPRYVFSVFLVSQLSALALEAALSECSRIKCAPIPPVVVLFDSISNLILPCLPTVTGQVEGIRL